MYWLVQLHEFNWLVVRVINVILDAQERFENLQ